jgi:hypothetical protein
MPDPSPCRDDDAPEFRSPKRALARSFRLSRDRWKDKATRRRQQVKALQVRLRDLEVSRDLWKDKAAHLEAQLQQLRGGAARAADGPAGPPDGGPPPPAAAPSTAPRPAAKKARRARR